MAAARWAILLVLAVGLPAAAERQITVETPTGPKVVSEKDLYKYTPAMALEASAKEVKRFGKIEFTIGAGAVGENRDDPTEIDMGIEFTAPSGKKFTVPAFYYRPY